MRNFSRREFLKIMGTSGSLAVIGCGSNNERRMISYLHPPGDVILGKPAWYAATCRECPAGCGMLVKNKDGRAIKVEGNPDHPINSGKLCPRGQATLHGLYNPDRFHQPLQKDKKGNFRPISWTAGESQLSEKIRTLLASGKGDKIVFMTDLADGTLLELIHYFLGQTGGGEYFSYHPYAYEALRSANRIIFDQDAIPRYRIADADFLISFGAGFLETWVSNVEYAHYFSRFHEPVNGQKNYFVYVGPRQSMTGANADHQIIVAPGDEYLVALALLRYMSDHDFLTQIPEDRRAYLRKIAAPFPTEVTAASGVPEAVIAKTARRFAEAQKPLALAGGLSFQSPHCLETAIAANLLCTVSPGTFDTVDFSRSHALGRAAQYADLGKLAGRLENGDVELLLIHEANPVFSLPSSWKFAESMSKVPMVVSFSPCMDETTQYAQLILPASTPLESWGDYIPQTGITGLMQPVMGNIHDTKNLGDILISVGRKTGGRDKFSPENFLQVLQSSWMRVQRKKRPDIPFKTFWLQALQRGGYWEESPAKAPLRPKCADIKFPVPETTKRQETGFNFTAYPTVQFYDGRMANRMWIQELPDPLTQATWGGWVEIHPTDADRLGIHKGDLVRIKSPNGVVEAPAIPFYTVNPGVLAMPVGQGHEAYGRFASNYPANPLLLFPPGINPVTGGPADTALSVTIEKTDGQFAIANTDGSYFQHGRKIHQEADLKTYTAEIASGRKPELDLPLPAGYLKDKDFYPPHTHGEHRWSMVVDLDRCIGCGACVVACYAENNVAVVGRKEVLLGREMSWIRVQRYFNEETNRPNWLVMLCQHCDNAPCESVCPVYAPHHGKEGLNNQVYNRCIGTRFCSQNDPYKVRRFNWFTFERPWPLDIQLNPDVTVRQKGVMEKCSFCIQRIGAAKVAARSENRKLRDGEFTTACAQTCPTDTLVFGDLQDPDSRVSKMINDVRTYQVLRHLNTKPAVFYLKKLTMEL